MVTSIATSKLVCRVPLVVVAVCRQGRSSLRSEREAGEQQLHPCLLSSGHCIVGSVELVVGCSSTEWALDVKDVGRVSLILLWRFASLLPTEGLAEKKWSL